LDTFEKYSIKNVYKSVGKDCIYKLGPIVKIMTHFTLLPEPFLSMTLDLIDLDGSRNKMLVKMAVKGNLNPSKTLTNQSAREHLVKKMRITRGKHPSYRYHVNKCPQKGSINNKLQFYIRNSTENVLIFGNNSLSTDRTITVQ